MRELDWTLTNSVNRLQQELPVNLAQAIQMAQSTYTLRCVSRLFDLGESGTCTHAI